MPTSVWSRILVPALVLLVLSAQTPAPRPAFRTYAEARAALGAPENHVPAHLVQWFELGKAAENAPAAVPAFKRRLAMLDEALRLAPAADASELRFDAIYCQSMLVALHDPEARKAVQAAAQGAGPPAEAAKTSLALAAWYLAPTAEVQTRSFEALRALVKANPASDELARALVFLKTNMPGRSPALPKALEALVLSELHGPFADRYRAQPHVGYPLAIAGTTTLGQPFTVAALKGKVVLVHFWSPNVGGSRVLLPYYAKLDKELKGQGLELVGVASAETAQVLARFLSDNKEYAWTQLFDAKSPKTHPLQTTLWLPNLTTVFLIDRAGNLAEITDAEHVEDFLPKLLAAKPPARQP